MKTKAVRIYGKEDLRLEEFELPALKNGEILIKVISDSVCMSTYKTAKQGAKHIRVPDNVAENPVIIGHELCGEIVQVGKNHQDKFKPGMRFAQQPALNYKGTMWSPGYSYEFFGGAATYCIIPAEVMELGCLMEYKGKAFYESSLAEPMSCCIGAFHAGEGGLLAQIFTQLTGSGTDGYDFGTGDIHDLCGRFCVKQTAECHFIGASLPDKVEAWGVK